MKSNKKLNAKDIIITRKRLDGEISQYWSYIKAENTLRKNAVAKFRFHNIPELHNQILQKIEQRIKIKGMLNQLNNGILKFDNDTFKKSHYYTIFRLQEAQEQIVKLNEIRKKCVAPQLKAQKGKKGTGFHEIFSYEKITSLISRLEQDVNTYKSIIEKYNNETEIEITDDSLNDILAAQYNIYRVQRAGLLTM